MPILGKHKVVGYFRYVDDILIIYNEKSTNINNMLFEFNTVSPKPKFTLELDINGRINFLDITITKCNTEPQPQIVKFLMILATQHSKKYLGSGI